MKLQVAIDRVPVEQAVRIIQAIDGQADIIEIGTSLTKEFGLRALRPVLEAASNTSVLADIKTCDEGAYEFDLGFDLGFDYLTVMGSASMGTLETCAKSTETHGRVMMIDLLECDEQRSNASAASRTRYTACTPPWIPVPRPIRSRRCAHSRRDSRRFAI